MSHTSDLEVSDLRPWEMVQAGRVYALFLSFPGTYRHAKKKKYILCKEKIHKGAKF